jgi:hypothetical protein
MKADIETKNEVSENIKKIAISFPSFARTALFNAGLFVQAEAQKRTPVDTGYLRSSAKTRMENDYTVLVSYDAAYAIFVHERTNLRHKVGEAKFLQNAIDKNKSQIRKIIENTIINGKRRVLGK